MSSSEYVNWGRYIFEHAEVNVQNSFHASPVKKKKMFCFLISYLHLVRIAAMQLFV